MQTALVLIDAQVNMFDPAAPVDGAGPLLARLGALLSSARRARVPIALVRNCGGEGDPDRPGTPGFEIHPDLASRPGEFIVDKEQCDSFADTELGHHLLSAGVGRIVLAGLQSDHCVQATVRGAVDLGFEIVLVSDGHSTYPSGGATAAELIERVNRELAPLVALVPAADIAWS